MTEATGTTLVLIAILITTVQSVGKRPVRWEWRTIGVAIVLIIAVVLGWRGPLVIG